jgi:hypothetical protein
MLTKLRGAARRAGYYDRSKDDFGRYVETYNGIPCWTPASITMARHR